MRKDKLRNPKKKEVPEELRVPKVSGRGRGEVRPSENKGRGRGEGRGDEFRGDKGKNRPEGRGPGEGKARTSRREFDRHSGMETGRLPTVKKGGGGKANWGTNEVEVPLVNDEWDDKSYTETPTPAETATNVGPKPEGENPAEPAPVVELPSLGMEDYLKIQEQKAAELAAKLGKPIEIRKLNPLDLSAAAPSKRGDKVKEKEGEDGKKSRKMNSARKGEKYVFVHDLFAPVEKRGTPSQRGRGGRGNFQGEGENQGRGNPRGNNQGRGRGAREYNRRGQSQHFDSTDDHQFPSLGNDK